MGVAGAPRLCRSWRPGEHSADYRFVRTGTDALRRTEVKHNQRLEYALLICFPAIASAAVITRGLHEPIWLYMPLLVVAVLAALGYRHAVRTMAQKARR
jgi:hypothetical protein